MDLYSLKENTTHGSVSFPLALYQWQGRYDWRVPLHWHDEMELISFTKGDFTVWLNTREYSVKAPAFICVHPGELHSLTLPAGTKESAIVFNLNILSFEHYDATQAKIIRPLISSRLKMPFLTEMDSPAFSCISHNYKKMKKKIETMNNCSSEKEMLKNSCCLQIKARLFDLLAELYAADLLIHVKNTGKEKESQIENLKKVLLYINENYSSPIRLDELSRLINLNTQYFCRYFKENIGRTVTEYINEIRIEKAAEALEETSNTIITIAQDCGFDNIGYFIRRFKKEKGMTPSEYRKSFN